MKHFFNKSGVKSIPYIDKINKSKVRKFVETYSYPIIVKPDKGSGASMTYKISSDQELDHFFNNLPPDIEFIVEDFIDGIIMTYDGLIDLDGNILFESSTVYEQSIMDVVNTNDHVHYISLVQVPEEVKQAGRKIIKAFAVGERFFHIELFKSRDNGEIYALEVNMRPPGAWMTDAINFTHDMDIYREWANMIVNGQVDGPFKGKYYTAYASRKNHKLYRYDHESILQKLNGKLVKHSPIDAVFSRAMGNYAYQFRSESIDEVKEIIGFIQEEIQ
jgi:biotin carboxylase